LGVAPAFSVSFVEDADVPEDDAPEDGLLSPHAASSTAMRKNPASATMVRFMDESS